MLSGPHLTTFSGSAHEELMSFEYIISTKRAILTFCSIWLILGNPGVTHSVPTAFIDECECSGYGKGHAWVTDNECSGFKMGQAWVTEDEFGCECKFQSFL